MSSSTKIVGDEGETLDTVVNTYPEDRLWGTERNPTPEELEYFRANIRDLPPELQQLRPPNEEVWLTIEKGRAETRGNRILLDSKYLRANSPISKHEYIHTLMSNNILIDESLVGKYAPPRLFRHASFHGCDIWAANSEQLTMILSAYNSDRNVWINQVKQIESWVRVQAHSEAIAQVEAVERYMRGIGIW